MNKKIWMSIVAVVFVIAAGVLFELEQQSPYTIITNAGDYKVGFRDFTSKELEQTVAELRRKGVKEQWNVDLTLLEEELKKNDPQDVGYREYRLQEAVDADQNYGVEVKLLCQYAKGRDGGFSNVVGVQSEADNPAHQWEVAYEYHKIEDPDRLKFMMRGAYVVETAQEDGTAYYDRRMKSLEEDFIFHIV